MMLTDFRITAQTADGRYRAVHVPTSRRVVIDVGHDTVAIVLAANALDAIGRGAPRLVEHGRLPDGRAWCATEAPDGLAIGDVLLRRSLSHAELAQLLRDTAAVLKAAHDHGVVHTQLSPENIFFGTGNKHAPVVIAGWLDMQPVGVAHESISLNTYSPPELAVRVDGRADIYALGLIAFHAVAGRFPNSDDNHVSHAPDALSRLIMRMCALDVNRRPSAAEVVYQANRLLEGDPAPRAIKWTPPHGMSVIAIRQQKARALTKS